MSKVEQFTRAEDVFLAIRDRLRECLDLVDKLDSLTLGQQISGDQGLIVQIEAFASETVEAIDIMYPEPETYGR